MARLSTSLHPKLTESAISILQSKKIYTVFDLMLEDSDKLMQDSGLTYQEVLDLKQKITKVHLGGIATGSKLLKASANSVIRTEIKSLDNLMKGGLWRGQIYEICGLSSSGKTQLCHTLAVNIAEKLDGIVHYIDTKGDFSAIKARAILNGKGCDEIRQGLVLDNIIVTRVETIEELMNFLHSLKTLRIKEAKNSIKLLLIDSLPAIMFNSSLDTAHFIHTCALNHFSNILKCVANELNAVFITINLISQWRENIGLEAKMALKNPMVTKPGLGKYWLSIPDTRLLIETIDFETKKISVWKSACLTSGSSCRVKITNAGVA